jgi:uncharacterized protein
MRYDETDEESKNIEDRRGQGGGMMGSAGGLPFPLPGAGGGGRGGFSLTTLLIIGAIMMLFGFNPLDILKGGLGGGGGGIPFPSPRIDPGTQGGPQIPGFPPRGGTAERTMQTGGEDEVRKFVGRVLKDTEDVWTKVFTGIGQRYTDPQLVLFTGATRTGCGMGQTQMGPFYCPLDQKVYLDLEFYQELERRFHAPGQFAQAYVVAHEVGHHVQTLLGISEKVNQFRERLSRQGNEAGANHVQVMMELQADCFAGVWANRANSMKNRIQPGDVESGLTAASAIGDDTLQKRSMGRVVPDSFTHGTSEQRVRWFKRGIDSGDIGQCDTFTANPL